MNCQDGFNGGDRAGVSREEDFDFYVEPKYAEFSAEQGGASRHLMVNGTDHRIAIKIKCSNNRLYKVSPVYTCLEPGKAKRLQVLREPGASNTRDKLVLIYKKTHLKNAKQAFQSDSGIGDNDEKEVEEGRDVHAVDNLAKPRRRREMGKKRIALLTVPSPCLHFTPKELGSLNSTPMHSAVAGV